MLMVNSGHVWHQFSHDHEVECMDNPVAEEVITDNSCELCDHFGNDFLVFSIHIRLEKASIMAFNAYPIQKTSVRGISLPALRGPPVLA
jgi:hypothetical protein